MFDIFIPTYDKHDEQLKILIRSLTKNLSFSDVESVNICNVGSIESYELVRSEMQSMAFPTELSVFDSGLLSCGPPNTRGWLRQQVAKLKFSEISTTEYYLVLDTKNILLEPLKLSSLLKRDRMPCIPSKVSFHPKWWRGAVWALGHSSFDMSDDGNVFGSITPAFFHRDTVRKMLEFMERRHEMTFQDFFLKRRYLRHRYMRPTEFTLYYCFLDLTNQFREVHYWSTDLIDGASQIWRKHSDQELQERVQRIIDGETKQIFTGIHHPAWNRIPAPMKANLEAVFLPL